MPRVIIIFSLILLLSCKANQRNENGNLEYRNALIKGLKFVKANTATTQEYDTITTVFDGKKYTLYPDGKIEIQKSNDLLDSLRLDTKDIIETAYFYSYRNSFLVFYTETDFDGSASFVECFDKNSNKLKWKNKLGGFNLSSPCILDSLCYIASIGFVGKLNLKNGKYFWKHEDLYERTRFDSFQVIEFKNDCVHFIQTKFLNDKGEPGRLIIDDETGEINEIIRGGKF